MHRRAAALAVSLALTVPLGLLAAPASAAPVVKPARPWDFDGDGRADLLVGAPGVNAGSTPDAGGVVRLRTTKDGIAFPDGQQTTQDSGDVAGKPTQDGYWGSILASADFDEDGHADLVVNQTVLFGADDGLTGARSYELPQAPQAPAGVAVGDFDGDGSTDLAVGRPTQDYEPGEVVDAPGAVRVFRGGAARFTQARSYQLEGVRTGSSQDRGFGAALTAGDLNGDGIVDLAVASRGPGNPDDEGYGGPGSLSVCYGTKGSGLTTGCTRVLHKNRYAGAEAIAVGNVTGSARNEIVLGIPYPEVNEGGASASQAGGAVEIVTLSGTGTGTKGSVVDVAQNSTGVPGSGEAFDGFGEALALGDLDGDGFADLVVGAPREADGKKASSGRVTLVYGGAAGYRPSGAKTYDQGTPGIPGSPEAGDLFGRSVGLLDHDGDDHLDLDVGAPGENGDEGAVTTLAGAGRSFTTSGSRTSVLGDLEISSTGSEPSLGAALGH